MAATLDTFDTEKVDPNGMYILVSNFYSQNGVTLGKDASGNLASTADNFRSGISEDAFYEIMEEFAERHGQEVLYEDAATVIMTGTPETYQHIQAECGQRFSYGIGSANMVQGFIEHEIHEREEMAMAGYSEDDDLYEAPHLDS